MGGMGQSLARPLLGAASAMPIPGGDALAPQPHNTLILVKDLMPLLGPPSFPPQKHPCAVTGPSRALVVVFFSQLSPVPWHTSCVTSPASQSNASGSHRAIPIHLPGITWDLRDYSVIHK